MAEMTSGRASAWPLQMIVSGGQTGVDRAALDVARTLGIAHGGWCPAGRRAEDGPIPAEYALRETDTPNYPIRTRYNIRDSDGTLIFHGPAIQGGTALTRDLAMQMGKPVLLAALAGPVDPWAIRQWMDLHHVSVLNVAGPRESEYPGGYQRATELLRQVLTAGMGDEER